jgi:hypothetical protein
MLEDAPIFSPVSHYYALMMSHIRGNQGSQGIRNRLDFLFLSTRKYIEREQKIRVIIEIHDDVKQGSALGILANNGHDYFILVSKNDAENNHDMLRLRVAHELAHVVCGHVQEGKYLCEQKLGNSGVENSQYDKWRHLIEDEADIFSMNMFLAHGRVAERHIPQEDDFIKNIGNLFIDVRPTDSRPKKTQRPSILNDQKFRKQIFAALREDGFLHPPLAILCHTLVDVFGQNEYISVNGSNDHRRNLSKKIHTAYRKRLANKEAKPPSQSCENCQDCLNEYCFS